MCKKGNGKKEKRGRYNLRENHEKKRLPQASVFEEKKVIVSLRANERKAKSELRGKSALSFEYPE